MRKQRQRDVKGHAARNGGTEIQAQAGSVSRASLSPGPKPPFLLVILAQGYVCWDLKSSSRHMSCFGVLGCPAA